MATNTPYGMLTGTWKFWLAPATETVPLLDVAPAGNWVALGATDGDQEFAYKGALTMFTDNHYTGPRKHVRPEEGFTVKAKLAHLTLEDRAKALSMASTSVATATGGSGGALSVKKLPLKRGFNPVRYSLLARGGAVDASNTMSPYVAGPAQLYIPIGVFDGEPSETYGKGSTPLIEFEFVAEIDSTQAAGYEFGYLEVQAS
jgi:hypothetical protein